MAIRSQLLTCQVSNNQPMETKENDIHLNKHNNLKHVRIFRQHKSFMDGAGTPKIERMIVAVYTRHKVVMYCKGKSGWKSNENLFEASKWDSSHGDVPKHWSNI